MRALEIADFTDSGMQQVERAHTTPPRDRPSEMLEPGGAAIVGGQCAAAVLVLLGLDLLLQRTALLGAPAPLVHGTHVLAAVLALVMVFRIVARRPAAPPAVLREAATSVAVPPPEAVAIRRNAEWLVGLRWLAVAAVAGAVILAVPVAGLLPEEVYAPLMVATLLLALANLVFERLLGARGGSAAFLLSQTLADLVMLTVLVHYSGGIENPLSVIYIFHVLIGSILLRREQAYLLAAAALALYAGMAFAEFAHLLPHYTLGVHPHDAGPVLHSSYEADYVASHVAVMAVLLFCSTYFATLLAGRLRRTEGQVRAAAAEALRQMQRLEGVVDASGAGLALLDSENRIEWMNPLAREWLGAIERDGQGAEAARLTSFALETGETQEAEFSHHSDGLRRYLLVTATPIGGADGSAMHVVELVQDVTARRAAEATVIQTGKLAAIGELAGKVAHEVNNPVGVISAKARLMLQSYAEHELPAKVRRDLHRIVEYGDRIAGITSGLLAFARPSSGMSAPVDVNQAVRRALELIAPRGQASRTGIELDLAQDLPQVSGNFNELQQVFVNLALNALDAMGDGGSLRIRTYQDLDEGAGGPVTVEFADTGPGVDPALRAHIFEPFFTTKAEGRGTGLGLSICHGLVRSHAGEIEVSGGPEGGAVFSVKLPPLA